MIKVLQKTDCFEYMKAQKERMRDRKVYNAEYFDCWSPVYYEREYHVYNMDALQMWMNAVEDRTKCIDRFSVEYTWLKNAVLFNEKNCKDPRCLIAIVYDLKVDKDHKGELKIYAKNGNAIKTLGGRNIDENDSTYYLLDDDIYIAKRMARYSEPDVFKKIISKTVNGEIKTIKPYSGMGMDISVCLNYMVFDEKTDPPYASYTYSGEVTDITHFINAIKKLYIPSTSKGLYYKESKYLDAINKFIPSHRKFRLTLFDRFENGTLPSLEKMYDFVNFGGNRECDQSIERQITAVIDDDIRLLLVSMRTMSPNIDDYMKGVEDIKQALLDDGLTTVTMHYDGFRDGEDYEDED